MKRNTELLLLVRRMLKLYEACLEDIRKKYCLSHLEIKIIGFLFNNPGKDTAGDISQLRMIPKGNVSQGVESLIQKSLLKRTQDEQDRRKIHLTLTEAADPVVEEIKVANQVFRAQAFSGFSMEEMALYRELNHRLMENLVQGLERIPYGDKQ